MRDNLINKRLGWNFLKDPHTHIPINRERWLFDKIGQDTSIYNRFIKPRTQLGIDRQAVKRYMDRVVAFREKLAILMHITSGQPARGPELLSIRHSNVSLVPLGSLGTSVILVIGPMPEHCTFQYLP
jgi:hypothetical protein